MASKPKKRPKKSTAKRKAPASRRKPARRRKARVPREPFQPVRSLRRWVARLFLAGVTIVLVWVSAIAFLNPPTTFYMSSERTRLGEVDQQWVPLEEMSPSIARSVVAAEDANFCSHWGFDMAAIRAALDDGANRGGSTLTQQVVKNVFLWQGRSWPRKALEALITPIVEAIWTKRRILEVYLNVAEFDQGVFGVEAASRRYFDQGPEDLSDRQAALLAAVLPNPKGRSAARPTNFLSNRAAAIQDGAATILADGRSACFED